ncbi:MULTISPECIES: 50S ribosomal protein L23 [Olsenella]|uniref:50S ribosomal protein L23 n=1 Tax=Olsenella TaxID=133925 RepID=UPI000231F02A|nr:MULTISPECIES: 50S ribosomal protein L23 [Olsenella]EHF02217.1 50S ribosomal protein L23 [Olsenella sp. oral taxon 809 str. F0356]KXB61752.1 ribosomal protein L23 [Olsenella sp. DNF00959]
MNSAYEVIIRPVVSERSFDLMSNNKYTFEVARNAPKEEIRAAVEKLFGVHVLKVNTLWVRPKNKRVRYVTGKTRTWKKAVVTIADGEQIEIFSNQQAAAEE